MKFTEEDIPLMKLIFNPSTHNMGMLAGGERAKEIVEYVCNSIDIRKEYLTKHTSRYYRCILCTEDICNFFWDKNIINTSLLLDYHIYSVYMDSPIAQKIWDNMRLDLSKLQKCYIIWLLDESPISKKIWKSGKLNLSLLNKEQIENFKQKFEQK